MPQDHHGVIIISVLVVLAFFAALAAMFMGWTPPSNDAVHLLVGALISAFTTVVQYWLGSSIGASKPPQDPGPPYKQ